MKPDHFSFTRRVALAGGSTALLGACVPAATMHAVTIQGDPVMTSTTALAGAHTVSPLPFPPGSLNGISEKIITSHHDHNYADAVKSLNRVERELSQTNADTPPFTIAGLREKELTYRNSKTLHEAYFANLGGDGRRSGEIEKALAQAYDTPARWEQHMRATGLALGGGSGWAILGYELDTGALRTFASGHHTQTLASAVPLLVMDMYEHAYQMDFGAAAAKYVDAFFANVNWDEVNRRLEHAQNASAAWRRAQAT